jgi:prepilin-type N-terminal cleavage/methylation domain-containing protein
LAPISATTVDAMKKNPSGFTLIELLVVIAIIAVLAAFAVPALTSALTRGQMTGTLNNMHQFHLAGQQMALDGDTNSDPTLGWPGDITSPAAITSLSAYCDKLISNNYLQAGDVKKILSAPSVNCTFTGGTTDPATGAYTVISGLTNPSLKVFLLKSNNPSNTIFAETANYTYNTALASTGTPYGDKGFIVQRKGGDAALLRKAQGQAGSGSGSGSTFQSTVGRVPGDTDGSAGSETGVILTSN